MQAFYLYYVTWSTSNSHRYVPHDFLSALADLLIFCSCHWCWYSYSVYYVRIIAYVFVHQFLSNKGFGLRGFWWALAGFQWVTYLSPYPHLSPFILSSLKKKKKWKIHMLTWKCMCIEVWAFFLSFVLSFITCRMPESKQSTSYLLVADWTNWHFQARFSLALQRVASPHGMLYCDEFQQPEFGKLKAT